MKIKNPISIKEICFISTIIGIYKYVFVEIKYILYFVEIKLGFYLLLFLTHFDPYFLLRMYTLYSYNTILINFYKLYKKD